MRLGRLGLAENDRKAIMDAAQRGDTDTAQRLLQEGFKKRDPAIAAEFQGQMDAENEDSTPSNPSEPQNAGTETSTTPAAPAPAPKTQGPSLPFAPSPNLEWHVDHDPARHLVPDKPFDATRKPTKPDKVLDKNDKDEGNIRGVNGENETARILAQNGYAYEQVVQNKKKRPDGTFEGMADGVLGKASNSKSDVFSPIKTKNIKGIHDVVSDKVSSQKSPYVTIRLEPNGQDLKELAKYFKDWSAPEL